MAVARAGFSRCRLMFRVFRGSVQVLDDFAVAAAQASAWRETTCMPL
jgi:hypothetical protein